MFHLKILHIGKYYHPETGGIESVTRDISEYSAKKGYDVTVLCFASGDLPKNELINDVSVIRHPVVLNIFSQPINRSYFMWIIKFVRNFDVVHVHFPNIIALFALLFIPNAKKIIVHWHSDIIDKGILGFLITPIQNLILRRCNLVITTSMEYASASKPLRKFRSKISVVPIGIKDPVNTSEIVKSYPVDKLLKKNSALPIHHKKIILAVGRLVNYKGFDVLIEAASSLPTDCAIIIVGTGPQKTTLLDKITKNKLEDKVFLLGTVDAETLELLYRVSYIFCLPSTTRAEAFGVVLLEALSHGLPIVSTNITGSGVGWVNQHSKTGLTVPVNQPRALADAIIKLLENPSLHKKLGKHCRLRFISTFEHNLCNQRIVKLYEKLMRQY